MKMKIQDYQVVKIRDDSDFTHGLHRTSKKQSLKVTLSISVSASVVSTSVGSLFCDSSVV